MSDNELFFYPKSIMRQQKRVTITFDGVSNIEDWNFIWTPNYEVIAIERNGSWYKREPDEKRLLFSCPIGEGKKERIELEKLTDRCSGEIRTNDCPCYFDHWNLQSLIYFEIYQKPEIDSTLKVELYKNFFYKCISIFKKTYKFFEKKKK